jgi:hypothetical protein
MARASVRVLCGTDHARPFVTGLLGNREKLSSRTVAHRPYTPASAWHSQGRGFDLPSAPLQPSQHGGPLNAATDARDRSSLQSFPVGFRATNRGRVRSAGGFS